MDYKKDLEKWLSDLKNLSLDRRKIEKELGYAENYIDQQLSKKSNNKFYNRIKQYHASVLEKARLGSKNIEDVILDMSVRQVAMTRVLLKGFSELLGNQPGKTVTGVQTDLDRAIKEEFEKLKAEIASEA